MKIARQTVAAECIRKCITFWRKVANFHGVPAFLRLNLTLEYVLSFLPLNFTVYSCESCIQFLQNLPIFYLLSQLTAKARF